MSDPFTGKQLRDIAMDTRGVVVTVKKLCSDWENELTTEKFRSGWNHDAVAKKIKDVRFYRDEQKQKADAAAASAKKIRLLVASADSNEPGADDDEPRAGEGADSDSDKEGSAGGLVPVDIPPADASYVPKCW